MSLNEQVTREDVLAATTRWTFAPPGLMWIEESLGAEGRVQSEGYHVIAMRTIDERVQMLLCSGELYDANGVGSLVWTDHDHEHGHGD